MYFFPMCLLEKLNIMKIRLKRYNFKSLLILETEISIKHLDLLRIY